MGQSTPERPVMRGKEAPAVLDASPISELKTEDRRALLMFAWRCASVAQVRIR